MRNIISRLTFVAAICLPSTLAFSAGPPQLQVSGSFIEIHPSTVSTDLLAGTDYGPTTLAQGITHVFGIYNSAPAGNDPLVLQQQVDITGPNAADFVITFPLSPQFLTLQASGNVMTGFSLRYQPSFIGPSSALVTIHSNDPVHPSFTFLVQGTCSPTPISAPDYKMWSPELRSAKPDSATNMIKAKLRIEAMNGSLIEAPAGAVLEIRNAPVGPYNEAASNLVGERLLGKFKISKNGMSRSRKVTTSVLLDPSKPLVWFIIRPAPGTSDTNYTNNMASLNWSLAAN
jgi:hypothetical protein